VSVGTGDTVTLWVTATDNVGVVNAEVSIDGGGAVSMIWDSGDSRWEYDYVAPTGDDSDHTYAATVYDAEGNSNILSHNIDVFDDENPMITNISNDVSVGTGDTVTLWVTATDNVGVVSAEVSIDGGGAVAMIWDSGDSRWEYDYVAPTGDDSGHTYSVAVFDAGSNSDSSSVHNIDVFDNDDPVITGSSGDVSVGTGDTVTLWVTATDNVGVVNAEVSIDGGGAVSMIWDSGDSRWEYDYVAPTGDDSDHTYSATVYDTSMNDDTSNIYDISVFDDENPSISNVVASPFSQIVNEYVNITGTVTDNIGINTVKVAINGPAGFPPINITMTNTVGNGYYYNNNYSIIGIYNYSIWAEDINGNANTSPIHQFEIITEVQVSDLFNQWNFISLPFNQSVSKNNLIINYNGTDYNWSDAVAASIVNDYIFGWNRDSQTYEFANILTPGFGYWLYAYDGCELRAESVTILPDTYITNIKQSWNIIGVPNDQNISKSNIIVDYSGTNYIWADAVTAGIVNNYVFGWSRATQSYNFADAFEPGYGYWMYAYYDCTLNRT